MNKYSTRTCHWQKVNMTIDIEGKFSRAVAVYV